MSDILKILRSPAMAFYEYEADKGAILRESADEIERLQGEVEALREERKARDSKDLIRNQKIYDLWQDRHHSENTRNQKP